MALFRLHITLPDRPGSLGAVASAIGFAGGHRRVGHAGTDRSDRMAAARV